MSICLSMIVKNEASIIARCLRSVKPFVSSYSISDTGSTDNTIEVIREELAGIPGIIEHDPWQNFSANRNLALSRATGDHVLLMDADEVLSHSGGPIELPDQYAGFDIRFIFGTLSYAKTKIVRNDGRWKYVGRTHEVLSHEGGDSRMVVPNLTIVEYTDSHSRVSGEKYLRDLAIFESDERTPRNVFYHAQTLNDLDRHEESLAKYQERIGMGGWVEEVYYSLRRIAYLKMVLNKPFEQVVAAHYEAYAYRPSRIEALAELCRIMRVAGRYEDSYRLSLGTFPPSEDILFVERWAEWVIIEEHAQSSYQLHKFAEAREYLQRLDGMELPPDVRERVQKNKGVLESILSSKIPSKSVEWETPERTQRREELQKLKAYVTENPTTVNLLQLSVTAYNAADYQCCLDASRSVLEQDPASAEAWCNLCASYNSLGMFEEGKKAGEEALKIRPDFPLAKANLNWSIRELQKHEVAAVKGKEFDVALS